ncbi:MAG: hypothetical protein RLZ98_46 [Pseudomonadota bacterium]
MLRIEVMVGLAIVGALAVPPLAEGLVADLHRSTPSSRDDRQSARRDEPVSVSVCPTGLKEREQLAHYDVTGDDPRAARASYEESRPHAVNYNGEPMRAAGLTNWRITYRYCRRDTGHSCALTTVETIVKVDYLMPRWVARDGARFEDRRRFDDFYDRLMEHEKGHGRIAKAGGREVYQALTGIGRKPSCDALDLEVRVRAMELIEDVKRRQRDYDRNTRHGVDQGIRYPFRT